MKKFLSLLALFMCCLIGMDNPAEHGYNRKKQDLTLYQILRKAQSDLNTMIQELRVDRMKLEQLKKQLKAEESGCNRELETYETSDEDEIYENASLLHDISFYRSQIAQNEETKASLEQSIKEIKKALKNSDPLLKEEEETPEESYSTYTPRKKDGQTTLFVHLREQSPQKKKRCVLQ